MATSRSTCDQLMVRRTRRDEQPFKPEATLVAFRVGVGRSPEGGRSWSRRLPQGNIIPGQRRCQPSLSAREDHGSGKAAERPLPTQARRATLVDARPVGRYHSGGTADLLVDHVTNLDVRA